MGGSRETKAPQWARTASPGSHGPAAALGQAPPSSDTLLPQHGPAMWLPVPLQGRRASSAFWRGRREACPTPGPGAPGAVLGGVIAGPEDKPNPHSDGLRKSAQTGGAAPGALSIPSTEHYSPI